jgi:GrpB-like predicted nucleotidyltransferase (UPF0157 family)
MLGLASGKVRIVPYTDEWRRDYETEEKNLRAAIGDLVLDIQHVGSTSVPGLAAKPIIDIAAFVASLDLGERCIGPLQRIGYEYKQDGGIPGRHFFAKGSKDNRTHYLHVEAIDGPLWKNHILFRDYLRRHPEAVEEYTGLKRELAERYKDDRDTYMAGKDAFIQGILAKAERELRL